MTIIVIEDFITVEILNFILPLIKYVYQRIENRKCTVKQKRPLALVRLVGHIIYAWPYLDYLHYRQFLYGIYVLQQHYL